MAPKTDWNPLLNGEFEKPYWSELMHFVASERARGPVYPPKDEVFAALQTGTMDGQENPYAQIHSAKFHEVQKYLSITGHVYTPAYVTVSAKKWATLPDDVRTALERIAKERSISEKSHPDRLLTCLFRMFAYTSMDEKRNRTISRRSRAAR